MSHKLNEHLKFLNQETSTIAAGTEEEFQAAEYISRIFEARGLQPEMEEFGISPKARLYKAIAYIVVFAGALMSGIPVAAIKILGTIFLIIAAALILLDELKMPIFTKVGPMAASQNVVAKHEGVGEKAGRGVRPIVIVAHYDTPQESYLASNGYSHFKPLLIKATFWGVVAALALSIFKLLFPVGAVYNTFWVISFICAIAPLACGILTIIDMNSPYTKGANNNKAALAAMFNVLDRVEGHGDEDIYENLGITIQETSTDQFEALTDEQIEADKAAKLSEENISYNHYGEEAIRMLGILPVDCEINYVYPEPVEVVEADIDVTQPLSTEAPKASVSTPADPEWGETEFEPLPSNFTRKSALVDLPDPREHSLDGLASEEDEIVDQIINNQPTMISNISEDLEIEQDVENTSESKFMDGVKKFGKSFKDWKDSKSDKSSHDWKGGATPNGKFKVIGGNEADNDEEAPTLEEMHEAILNLAEDEQTFIDAQETPSEEVTEQSDSETSSEEIVDDIMEEVEEENTSNIDDDLISHDIWFVALGSSEEDHQGMKEFLSEHRKELRGAFLINLDGIGSGDLTLVTEEGLHNSRRADRRITRIVKGIAKDMGLPLMTASHTFADTDATPAMRTSLRCVTLMGTNSEGKAQHGSLLDNDLSEIDSRQIAETSYLVEELIRRS